MSLTIIQNHSHTIDGFLKTLYTYDSKLHQQNATTQKDGFIDTFQSFKLILHSTPIDLHLKKISNSIELKKIKKRFREYIKIYYTYVQSQAYLESHTKKSNSIKSLCKRESFDLNDLFMHKFREFSGLENKTIYDTIVCIESGSLAQTAIFLSQHFSCKKIIAINSNAQNTYLASIFIKKLGITNIELITTNPKQFDYAHTDVVFIPSIVTTKQEVLDRISSTKTIATTVIVQHALGLYQLLYKNINPINQENFEFISSNDASRKYSKRLSCIMRTI